MSGCFEVKKYYYLLRAEEVRGKIGGSCICPLCSLDFTINEKLGEPYILCFLRSLMKSTAVEIRGSPLLSLFLAHMWHALNSRAICETF